MAISTTDTEHYGTFRVDFWEEDEYSVGNIIWDSCMIIQINHHCQPIDGTSVERDYPQGILFKQDSGNT